MSTTPRYLSTEQAAELLGVSPATLLKWRVQRRGPPFLKLGRRVIYSESALRAWADMHAVSPTRDWRQTA
jgi:excisionase family DNA binding protein